MTPSRGISVAFFLSGAAGLIFEVVWFHRFGLVFGQSVGATSIVLSSFMGGLALGSALVRARPRPLGNALRAYAVLEVIVAATGVALTYALPHLPALTATLPRLVASFAALMIPTTAMGATLPLLVGSWPGGDGQFDRALGHLYGWNTLGAVCGALFAELVLVARVGVAGSAWGAAALNLGLGLWRCFIAPSCFDAGKLEFLSLRLAYELRKFF